MKETSTKSVASLLAPNHRDLGTVLSKVKAIQTLNRTIIPLLEPRLQKYCQVANLANGVLVLLTANGSVATELRYATPDLLRKLRESLALKHIREIQCKVRPPTPAVDVERGGTRKQAEKKTMLSTETSETLLAMAETIEDPELRATMQRIAAHATDKR
tara:strand:+ start:2054 stop:2530 length:477 start_codon:yes stop_codon:yes gene_type:complete